LRRSSDKDVTFCAYPHLTTLRRKIAILLVNSTVRNPSQAGRAYKIRERIMAKKNNVNPSPGTAVLLIFSYPPPLPISATNWKHACSSSHFQTYCFNYSYIDYATVDFVMTPVILATLRILIWLTDKSTFIGPTVSNALMHQVGLRCNSSEFRLMRDNKEDFYTSAGESIPSVSWSAGARETSRRVSACGSQMTTCVVRCTLVDICVNAVHVKKRTKRNIEMFEKNA